MGVTEKDRGRHIVAGTPIIVPLVVPGALAAGDGKAHYKWVHFPATVKQIVATLQTLHSTSTGGGGENIMVRNVTDTADLMTTANKIVFTDTYSDASPIEKSSTQLQNTDIAIGDVLAVDVDVIDSGTGAADLTVFIVAERKVD